MIYGFAYLGMVLAISSVWVLIAVLKKTDSSKTLAKSFASFNLLDNSKKN